MNNVTNEISVGRNKLKTVKTMLLRNAFYIFFVVLIIVFSGLTDKFLTVSNFINVLQQTAPYAIVTVGMTFVLITGGIDLSVTSIMLFGASITTMMTNSLDTAWPVALIIITLIGTGFGLVNGVLVGHLKIVPFLATLTTTYVIRGFSLLITQNQVLLCNEEARFVGSSNVLGIPISIIFLIAALLIGNYILRKVPLGRHFYAVGNDPTVSALVGINVKKTKMFAYMLSGIFASVAAFMTAAQTSCVPADFGSGFEFVAISAAVIGGTSLAGGKGSVLPGALIGALMITVILNGLALINASQYLYTIVRGGVIFIAVFFDSIMNSSGELK